MEERLQLNFVRSKTIPTLQVNTLMEGYTERKHTHATIRNLVSSVILNAG